MTAAPHDTTLRNQERREAGQWRELDAAREEVSELRKTIAELQTESQRGLRLSSPQQRKHVGPIDVVLQPIRTSDDADAAFEGRSLEFMRRIVDECNCSFEAACTANALVLQWHLGDAVPDGHLTSATAFRRSFLRAGIADEEAAAAQNAADPGPWSIAQDAGGGTLMVAIGQWDAKAQQPVARPLAAADLFRDQGARNGVKTLEAAIKRGALKWGHLVAGCSDGTDHAVQENEGVCQLAHELGGHLVGVLGGQPLNMQLAQAVFCCIHGKALEENGGMEAAFPDNYLVDAGRLLWEVVAGPEGRPRFYRGIWTRVVSRGDGTTIPALPAHLFDQHLRSMAEPTESKWQVMFDWCFALLPLLESFGNVAQVSAWRCYLEIFFEKCLVLFCGTTDQAPCVPLTRAPQHQSQPSPPC